jgi:hypothetical protein
MLRNIILALGATMVVAGIGGILAGAYAPAALGIVWGAIMAGGIVYEHYFYRTIAAQAPAGKHWVQISERYTEKKTGKTAIVYYHTLTGERIYVATTPA